MPESRTLSTPVYHGPIPRCNGPKLDRFPLRKAIIDFRTLISDPDSEGQAHVFEVKIGPRSYALKVFKFYDDGADESALIGDQRDYVSRDLLHAHSDPFYRECRAYGRLKEKGLDGKLAVRCYGYTTLPAAIEPELEERFDVTDWGRDDYEKPINNRAVFRAIVKDIVRSNPPLLHRVAKKIWKDLRHLHKLEIYPCDIVLRNYVNGLLVDFSNAITEPHYLFDIMDDGQIEWYRTMDLVGFDKMIVKENVRTWIRAMPNKERLKTLRRREYLQSLYEGSTPSIDG